MSLDDNDARRFSTTVSIVGNDVTVTESTLEGDRTDAPVMEIESSSSPDIGNSVNISDKLNLVLRFTSRSGRAAYRHLHNTSKARLDRCIISSFFAYPN